MPTRTRTPKPPRLPAPSEKDVLKGALDLISARRIFCWRNNSGALLNAQGRPVKFGRPGSPDIVGVLPESGRLLGAEAKAGDNRPTAEQAAFLAELQHFGAAAFWFNDLKQLNVFLDAALAGWTFATNASGESVAWPPKEG
jgi:hypothetical protein